MTLDSSTRTPPPPLSLSTAAARNLTSTTKSVPQIAAITPRWLLRILPWVRLDSATYRVNRRLSYRAGDGRVTFVSTGGRIQVIPDELRELPMLRGFGDGAGQRVLGHGVSAYYSVAVLVPDALGILEHVEIGHRTEETWPAT